MNVPDLQTIINCYNHAYKTTQNIKYRELARQFQAELDRIVRPQRRGPQFIEDPVFHQQAPERAKGAALPVLV